MHIYADLVLLFNFAVDLLLLLGADRLCGYRTRLLRCAAAAGAGSLYAVLCLFRGLWFLNAPILRLVVLGLMAAVAYGCSRGALRRCLLFAVLSLALGGGAMLFGAGGAGVIVLAVGLFAMTMLTGGMAGMQRFLPVSVTYQGRTQRFYALYDTGNTLLDPVTGQGVLVVAPGVAMGLLGLTPVQLSQPAETLMSAGIRGLRLIPYEAVSGRGMLLAMEFEQVQIDGKVCRRILAFAPGGFGDTGKFQALTGGV